MSKEYTLHQAFFRMAPAMVVLLCGLPFSAIANDNGNCNRESNLTGAESVVSVLKEGSFATEAIRMSLKKGEWTDVIMKTPASAKYCAEYTYGGICAMSHENAKSYCSSQGMHLPSAREYAQKSVRLGAVGITETSGLETEHSSLLHQGYWPIDRSTSSHNTYIDFYYKSFGYKRPSSVFNSRENIFFWTSTVVETDIYGSARVAHFFCEDDGTIMVDKNTKYGTFTGYLSRALPVRCVSGLDQD